MKDETPGTKPDGTTEPKPGEVDPKIAELMKDPDAVAHLLKTKQEANAEAKTYREKLEALDKKKQDDEKTALAEQGKFKDLAEKEKVEKAELKRKYSERAVLGELKTEAIKAEILDLDTVILADKSKVVADDDFNVTGASDAIAALKKGKPFLFKVEDGTPPATPPGTPPASIKTALINPHKEGESPEDRITRGLEAAAKRK